MREGGFKVSFSQGINIRVITQEIAEALASVEYRCNKFRDRRLYTAWDAIGDERLFLRGVDTLERAGIPGSHLMAYMLTGFADDETWPDIRRRFDAMVARKVLPYPMVFRNPKHPPEHYRALKRFQRWALTGLYRAITFEDYDIGAAAARMRLERDRRETERLGQATLPI